MPWDYIRFEHIGDDTLKRNNANRLTDKAAWVAHGNRRYWPSISSSCHYLYVPKVSKKWLVREESRRPFGKKGSAGYTNRHLVPASPGRGNLR